MSLKFLKLGLVLAFWSIFISSCSGGVSDPDSPSTDIDKPTPTTKEHFAGTWVTNVGTNVLDSKANIEECVATCKKYHINNIYVCVWNKGMTLYPSKVMKEMTGIEQMDNFVGRDPLKDMIEVAHKQGIKVHAWFEYGFASGNGQAGPLLTKNPLWASKDQNGKDLVKNNFHWMNAFMPEVQNFILSLVSEVVKNYDVDGIQGDDRLPALPSEGGYDEYTVNMYKKEHTGSTPSLNTKDAAWVDWRCAKLTQFMEKLYTTVKSIKPSIIVSSAPGIYPWAKNEYLQDWPTWLNKGYIDYVIPQIYRYDIANYHSTLAQQVKVAGSNSKKLYAGMLIKNGTYKPEVSFIKGMIEANRSNSITGECFWYYNGLKENDVFFQTYK